MSGTDVRCPVLTLRGVLNLIVAVVSAGIAAYFVVSGVALLISDLEGTHPVSVAAWGVLCLDVICVLAVLAVLLAARGSQQVRGNWPDVSRYLELPPPGYRTLPTFSFAIFAATVIAFFYILVWGWPEDSSVGTAVGLYILALFLSVPGSLVHEAIHAFVWWVRGGVSPERIRLGYDRSDRITYIYTDADMSLRRFRFALALPIVMLAFIPACVGIAVREPILAAYSAVIMRLLGADFLLLWFSRGESGDRATTWFLTELELEVEGEMLSSNG